MEANVETPPTRERPPKQWKCETEEQFKNSPRYQRYVAAEPHDVEIKPKGMFI